ncbi:MAG: hypothetical protein Kow0027_08960 [Saprospiraceae bacterium]
MEAFRIESQVKIDGKLDDDCWQGVTAASGFVQNMPNPGASPTFPTEVLVAYDDVALYIAARLYDTHPDSIFTEMSERDRFANTDWFGVFIDAYRDGNNGYGFAVTPTGIQKDLKFSANSGGGDFGGIVNAGDSNWDAVWDAATAITPEGWVVEMKIPYSAIRFPNGEEQQWGINFAREVRRLREVSYWNEVDPNIQGYLNQSGLIRGISNIKSPVRLSATPFFSAYAENYYDKNGSPRSSWGRSFNGGMDIKYGINDAFTLDMTLVPDFGQVRSDNEVLNLSPFEVRFDENRQFFTEGTELFNKGGLFYSRRVGGRPLHYGDVYDELADNEEVESNPAEAQLINATKVSGRTSKGLGIGVFNAIAAREHATIVNTETGEKRSYQTSPLTNYNILVFDQNLPNNSYFSLINTNVWREGADYEANVTGTRFQFRNKAQSYAFDGKAVLTQKYHPDNTDLGHSYFAGIRKTSGIIQWNVGYNVESYNYDPNDLGFIFSPNERSLRGGASYNINEPFGKFHEAHFSLDAGYQRLQKPDVFVSAGFGLDTWLVTATRIGFGVFTWIEPAGEDDYFEPRTGDFSRFYHVPASWNIGGFISTDYRKKLAMDCNLNFRNFNEDGRYRFNVEASPRYRVNDRLSFRLSLNSSNSFNDVGYVSTRSNGDIIFGRRQNITFSTVLNTSYIFTNRMSFSLRVRHYWSKAEYESFHQLTESGSLAPTDYNEFSDSSFDAFTVDAVYRWRFAPGSDIFIVWKNNTSSFDYEEDQVIYNYRKGLSRLTDFPQNNSLSVKVIYFLDYLYFKK